MAKNDDLARIIIGCKNGDAECFSQVVDIYAGRCYGYFYRLTGNTDVSDELLSELFVKLVEKIGSYRGGSFDGWLFRVANNIFQDHLRAKHRRKKLLESFDVRKSYAEAETEQVRKAEDEMTDKLQEQFAKLDVGTRELISLRFHSQMSVREIAEIRSEPIGTTLSKLHRGLKRLREMMAG